jgi:hypothetical protein
LRCRFIYALYKQDSLGAVHFLKFYFHDFATRGLHHPADVSGFNGKLAVAAVNQYKQLHARGPSMIKQRIQRGPNRPARVEDVIHEHDISSNYRKPNLVRMQDRPLAHSRKIVAVEVDVQDSNGNLQTFKTLNLRCEPLSHRSAAPFDPDKREPIQIVSFFE